MRVVVSKMIAGGEQIEASIDGPPKVIQEQLPTALQIMDGRLWEMNQRVLRVNGLYQKLVKEHPKAAIMVNDIIEVLVGRKVVDDTSVEAAVRAAELEDKVAEA